MKDRRTEIANWLYEKVKEGDYVYQETVVSEIEEVFGEEYVYSNYNGNMAIDKDVLKAFRKTSPDVVWNRVERYWRLKDENDDAEGRQV